MWYCKHINVSIEIGAAMLIFFHIALYMVHKFVKHTANVCRDLQGLCGEIGVWGFQIYGDCMYTRNPCNF